VAPPHARQQGHTAVLLEYHEAWQAEPCRYIWIEED
jgi:hypothetical protein